MANVLVCPKCRERLWVGDIQIPLVTCPRCLSRLINPNAAPEPLAREPVARTRLPRQVIPLEDEVDSDILDTTRWLSVLSLALFIGGILIEMLAGLSILSVVLAISGIVVAVAITGMHFKSRQESRQIREASGQYLQRVQRGDTTVFDYASPHPQASVGSFLGGFVLAIGLSFLTLIVVGMARGVGRSSALIAIVVGISALAYLGYRASQRRQNAGFFSGVMSGLILGAMGCGPCALMGVLS